MKMPILILVVIGVVAAGSASLLIASLRSSGTPEAAKKGEPTKVQIVVASRSMTAMEIVPDDAVTIKTVLKSEAPAHAFSESVQVVGKVLIVPVVEGQVLTRQSFAQAGSAMHLASALPGGMRAVSVSLSEQAAMEGLLYPGCAVDVLASFRLNSNARGQALSTTLLRGVQVLGINRRTIVTEELEEQEKTGKAKASESKASMGNRRVMVTLLVSTRQAEALQLAMGYGSISLTLRNPRDSQEVDQEATVLNGGQLAKLADLLTASVGGGDDDLDPSSNPLAPDIETIKPKPVEAPAPAPAPVIAPPPAVWETTIIRGDKFEKRQFPLPINESTVPKR